PGDRRRDPPWRPSLDPGRFRRWGVPHLAAGEGSNCVEFGAWRFPLELSPSRFSCWLLRCREPRAQAPTIGIDEIHAGMKGYGESVFVGTATERFDVEVLGVLRDVAPDTSYILARLTGRNLEKLGVVAGMSGSPVWIDGKLAGAVALGWAFSQEAIAG